MERVTPRQRPRPIYGHPQGWLASRRGDDQTGIVTLAVAVGARMWLDDHGCACGSHHTPGAGS